jgi:hypothetical protein
MAVGDLKRAPSVFLSSRIVKKAPPRFGRALGASATHTESHAGSIPHLHRHEHLPRFYRVRGRESGLSILKHIDDNVGRFITTNQIEMEFKKNRQRVIVESHALFKMPSFEGLQLPAFLSESKQSKALLRNQKQLKGYATTLKGRMTRILKNPTTHDPVFKTAQRLFRTDSAYNLSRDKRVRLSIRIMAKKRFILGYPPRKSDDTSIGDPINWEWIVHCASASGCNIVIVTRDSDYGVSFDQQSILNDWLATEFRDRVSKKRKLLLTDRLSTALKLASIPVTKQEVATEAALISERRARTPKPGDLMEALRQSLDRVRAARASESEFAVNYEPSPEDFDPQDHEPSPEDFDPDDYEPGPEDFELDPDDQYPEPDFDER